LPVPDSTSCFYREDEREREILCANAKKASPGGEAFFAVERNL
jgi:hypothetical protein